MTHDTGYSLFKFGITFSYLLMMRVELEANWLYVPYWVVSYWLDNVYNNVSLPSILLNKKIRRLNNID